LNRYNEGYDERFDKYVNRKSRAVAILVRDKCTTVYIWILDFGAIFSK